MPPEGSSELSFSSSPPAAEHPGRCGRDPRGDAGGIPGAMPEGSPPLLGGDQVARLYGAMRMRLTCTEGPRCYKALKELNVHFWGFGWRAKGRTNPNRRMKALKNCHDPQTHLITPSQEEKQRGHVSKDSYQAYTQRSEIRSAGKA